eukprot:CAMPEP_0195111732 /NCGR_PEP_ID=MMETSP0448-20130528/96962_1 /TAXON_ID=66468 /ORGANISM="Heterocapsa triquestra, Strain CCMP 448" /LENGTH=46 /DNA_ID= /DNA_START= /DNA_END= /DNA_ORIENTATION=
MALPLGRLLLHREATRLPPHVILGPAAEEGREHAPLLPGALLEDAG